MGVEGRAGSTRSPLARWRGTGWPGRELAAPRCRIFCQDVPSEVPAGFMVYLHIQALEIRRSAAGRSPRMAIRLNGCPGGQIRRWPGGAVRSSGCQVAPSKTLGVGPGPSLGYLNFGWGFVGTNLAGVLVSGTLPREGRAPSPSSPFGWGWGLEEPPPWGAFGRRGFAPIPLKKK